MKRAIAAVAQFLILATLAGCDFLFCSHPTDIEMLRKFHDHHSEFEMLRKMVIADKGVDRIALTWTRPEDFRKVGLTAERVEEYRKILRNLDLPMGVEGFETRPDLVFVLASGCGLSIAGSSKSYVWRTQPIGRSTDSSEVLTDNVDTYVAEQKARRRKGETAAPHLQVYRRIEGDWYIYYDD